MQLTLNPNKTEAVISLNIGTDEWASSEAAAASDQSTLFSTYTALF